MLEWKAASSKVGFLDFLAVEELADASELSVEPVKIFVLVIGAGADWV